MVVTGKTVATILSNNSFSTEGAGEAKGVIDQLIVWKDQLNDVYKSTQIHASDMRSK